MNRVVPITFILLLLISKLQAQKEITYADNCDAVMTIDGEASEWKQPFRYYDGATKLEFSFRNNSRYLFLCIKTSDEMAQVRVLNAGLELSVSTSKKFYSSISFPMKREKNSAQPAEFLNQDRQKRVDRSEIKRLMVAEIKTMKIEGFKSLPSGIYSTDIPEGVKTATAIDTTGALIVEYRIPFSLLYVLPDTSKPISVSIMLGAMEMPGGDMPPPPGGGMQGPPDGMGGGRSMGGGDFGGGGGMPNAGGMGGGDFGGGGVGGPGMGGGMPPGGGAGGPPPGGFGPAAEQGKEKTIKLKLKLASW